jgi:predicted RNA-binding Zn-ribbon protein involved in translation (DUF1610 family)
MSYFKTKEECLKNLIDVGYVSPVFIIETGEGYCWSNNYDENYDCYEVINTDKNYKYYLQESITLTKDSNDDYNYDYEENQERKSIIKYFYEEIKSFKNNCFSKNKRINPILIDISNKEKNIVGYRCILLGASLLGNIKTNDNSKDKYFFINNVNYELILLPKNWFYVNSVDIYDIIGIEEYDIIDQKKYNELEGQKIPFDDNELLIEEQESLKIYEFDKIYKTIQSQNKDINNIFLSKVNGDELNYKLLNTDDNDIINYTLKKLENLLPNIYKTFTLKNEIDRYCKDGNFYSKIDFDNIIIEYKCPNCGKNHITNKQEKGKMPKIVFIENGKKIGNLFFSCGFTKENNCKSYFLGNFYNNCEVKSYIEPIFWNGFLKKYDGQKITNDNLINYIEDQKKVLVYSSSISTYYKIIRKNWYEIANKSELSDIKFFIKLDNDEEFHIKSLYYLLTNPPYSPSI